MKKSINALAAPLIPDLEARELLKHPLAVLAAEFGRSTSGRGSAQVVTLGKPKPYGRDDYFADALSLPRCGGGVKRG